MPSLRHGRFRQNQTAVSPAQQRIVEVVQQGVTDLSQIAKRLGLSEGIVRAQLTRIRNSGNGRLVESVNLHESTSGRPTNQPSGQPTNVGKGSSNQQVLQEATEAGQAVYELPDELVNAARQFTQDRDIHPMVLLGTTIQYVKFVGGRLYAHQLIEQVYEALRAMVSDGSPKVGEENWSEPWPLNSVEMENTQLKERIAELERQALEAHDA